MKTESTVTTRPTEMTETAGILEKQESLPVRDGVQHDTRHHCPAQPFVHRLDITALDLEEQ